MQRNGRGLLSYGEIIDSRKCVVRVQQSSAAAAPHVWIFVDDPTGVYSDGNPSPHLTREQAQQVIEALQRFVDGAE